MDHIWLPHDEPKKISDIDFKKISKNVTWVTCGSNEVRYFCGVKNISAELKIHSTA